MERKPSPELLPILRSRQQAGLLTAILDHSEEEYTLAELTRWLGIPTASIHREIERAEKAGLVESRRVGRSRLVRANTESPYYGPLRDLLVMAFGPPARLRDTLHKIEGIDEAYIFGSWAAAWYGEQSARPVGDIDLLVLGEPDRDALYAATHAVGLDLGREVQVRIRPTDWIEHGTGSVHDTVTARPMVEVLPSGQDKKAEAASTALPAS